MITWTDGPWLGTAHRVHPASSNLSDEEWQQLAHLAQGPQPCTISCFDCDGVASVIGDRHRGYALTVWHRVTCPEPVLRWLARPDSSEGGQ